MADKQEPVHIQRDPFGRRTLYRMLCHTTKPCQWCGSRRASTTGTMFRYAWMSDDSRQSWADIFNGQPVFCSISCWRTYYG